MKNQDVLSGYQRETTAKYLRKKEEIVAIRSWFYQRTRFRHWIPRSQATSWAAAAVWAEVACTIFSTTPTTIKKFSMRLKTMATGSCCTTVWRRLSRFSTSFTFTQWSEDSWSNGTQHQTNNGPNPSPRRFPPLSATPFQIFPLQSNHFPPPINPLTKIFAPPNQQQTTTANKNQW